MSTYTSTEWTCDRCGFKVEVGAHASPPEQPLGWAALYEVRPPLMSPSESPNRPEQICPACLSAYFEWFAGA